MMETGFVLLDLEFPLVDGVWRRCGSFGMQCIGHETDEVIKGKK